MLKIVKSTKFIKDLRLAKARGLDLSQLGIVIYKLCNQEKLEPKYKDHFLEGKYKGFRECHIKPNWLLIYRINKDELELYVFRTGTHSDLF